MLALVIGTLLAVGALAFVLFPLFAPAVAPRKAVVPVVAENGEQESVAALREIEFDRATGKLSDSDYDELRARYTESALAAMRGATSATGDDPVEAAITAFRARLKACARCGPRPEPDALYCSDCGSYLPGACASCGAQVSEVAAAYCKGCGHQLAA